MSGNMNSNLPPMESESNLPPMESESNLPPMESESNLPPVFAIGSNLPPEPKVKVSLASGESLFSEYKPKMQARLKPVDENCLVIFDRGTPHYVTDWDSPNYGASWYVMRFKDRNRMLAYAKTRKSYKGDIALPYVEGMFVDLGFATV